MITGKRVACLAKEDGDGTWAEYMVPSVNTAMELDANVNLKEVPCFFVNPLTVMAMAEICKKNNYGAVIHTAACSAIGKMMFRLFRN